MSKVKRYGGLTAWEIVLVVLMEAASVYFFIYKGYCGG